jgi:hypothetical protein
VQGGDSREAEQDELDESDFPDFGNGNNLFTFLPFKGRIILAAFLILTVALMVFDACFAFIFASTAGLSSVQSICYSLLHQFLLFFFFMELGYLIIFLTLFYCLMRSPSDLNSRMRILFFFVALWIIKPIAIKGLTVFFPVTHYQCMQELVPYGEGNYYVDIIVNTLGLVSMSFAVFI